MSSKKNRLLAIGGLDPSGHAGLLADCRVFNELKIPCHAVATAVTAQSEKEFFSWKPVDLRLFREELKAVEGKIFGIKIGMLATLGHVKLLVTWLKKIKPRILLWDPVLKSSTGTKLLKARSFHPILKNLLEITDIFTPNLPEAEWFLGRRLQHPTQIPAALCELFAMGGRTGRVVILKGGHPLKKDFKGKATDWFFDGKKMVAISSPRLPYNRRGTGCTYGAALLAEIYLGKKPLHAARHAKEFVLNKILLGSPQSFSPET